jgi:hypothetical protein
MAFKGAGPRIDLVLDPNTDNPFLFDFVDESGVAINFTGSTFKLQAKAVTGADEPTGSALLTLATGSGISGTLSQGQFNPTFPKYVASPLAGLPVGRYVYTCLRLESAAPVEPFCWGFLDVNAGVAST